MALPEFTKKTVEKTLLDYCDKRVPKHIRDQLRLEFSFKGNAVVLFEVRPVWNDPSRKTEGPVAQFKYNQTKNIWTLYWLDRHSKWHIYDRIGSTATFQKLLTEVDTDPTGIFWG